MRNAVGLHLGEVNLSLCSALQESVRLVQETEVPMADTIRVIAS